VSDRGKSVSPAVSAEIPAALAGLTACPQCGAARLRFGRYARSIVTARFGCGAEVAGGQWIPRGLMAIEGCRVALECTLADQAAPVPEAAHA
jgi:ribosomal protein L37AE/L43A